MPTPAIRKRSPPPSARAFACRCVRDVHADASFDPDPPRARGARRRAAAHSRPRARLLRDRSARFELIPLPPLTAEDTLDMLGPAAARDVHEADYLARTVQALGDGRPMYVRALADELAAAREHGGPEAGDPISALA